MDPALSSHKSEWASEVLMGFFPEALRWRSGLAQASLISENSVESGRARLAYSLRAEELQETGSWDLAWTSPSGFEGSFCAGLLPNWPFPSGLPNPFRCRPSASPPPFLPLPHPLTPSIQLSPAHGAPQSLCPVAGRSGADWGGLNKSLRCWVHLALQAVGWPEPLPV